MFQNSIGNLLGSKRFISVISGLAGMLIVSVVPALADQAEQINNIVLVLVMSLVASFTVTDSVEANATAKIEAAKASAAK